jgi:glucuronate isomerase
MMKKFNDEFFLLKSNSAEKLYLDYAAKMPILDFHCHLSPKDIAEDRMFNSITEAWLEGDHYKWRAMRTNGINEAYITGSKDDFQKFTKWAETVPYTLRNPLYHWTHLELKRYFGIETLLNPQTAKRIFDETSEKLRSNDYSVRNLLRKMNVTTICTTDDPIDTLEYHQKIKADKFSIDVLPAWRPDKAMAVENVLTYNAYIDKLGAAANISIDNFQNLLDALKNRHDFFHANGCRVSDHGLDTFYAEAYTDAEISTIFIKIRGGKQLDAIEILKFKSAMLYQFALLDHEKDWVQQFHIGALRNNSSRMMKSIGPDTGFDSIGDAPVAQSMSRFLDKLDKEDKLAKTIFYNLNPADNEVYATMSGNFQDGITPGKIQWGAAWWFLDQRFGMEKHLDTLSSLGLLSRFVGMLTDSRSFLSYPRHEYFRRILCNCLGTDIENGDMPADFDLVGKMVQDISYNNAKNYFKI